MDDFSELEGLEELTLADETENIECFLVKDIDGHSIIGFRYKTYWEAKNVADKFSDRKIKIIKVIRNNGKREYVDA